MIEIKLDGYTLFEMETTKDIAYLKEQVATFPEQIAAAVAEERERCAKVCEANDDGQREDDRDIVWAHCCESCAAAIRIQL